MPYGLPAHKKVKYMSHRCSKINNSDRKMAKTEKGRSLTFCLGGVLAQRPFLIYLSVHFQFKILKFKTLKKIKCKALKSIKRSTQRGEK
jgi:hypothetical protein